VLSRPGRYRKVSDNLHVKEVELPHEVDSGETRY
jgi:hypothetical protein